MMWWIVAERRQMFFEVDSGAASRDKPIDDIDRISMNMNDNGERDSSKPSETLRRNFYGEAFPAYMVECKNGHIWREHRLIAPTDGRDHEWWKVRGND
jgi:hypothetical protein